MTKSQLNQIEQVTNAIEVFSRTVRNLKSSQYAPEGSVEIAEQNLSRLQRKLISLVPDQKEAK